MRLKVVPLTTGNDLIAPTQTPCKRDQNHVIKKQLWDPNMEL